MPKIIDKSLDGFYEEDRRRALQYVPEWRPADERDFGLALLRIFSHMREEIASRLNRVPEKNFAAFLSMIGTCLSLPSPSKVPVTFYPAKGFSQSIFIGAGTQVTAPENERHGILVFEVLRGISLTKVPLSQIFSVNPASDAIYCHTKDHLEGRALSPFQGESLQEHVLFLGEKRLFKMAGGGDVTLEFISASEDKVPDLSRLSWRCTTENGSEEIQARKPIVKGKSVSITLTLPKGELKEEEISGRSSIWISCKPESFTQSALISLSRIRVSKVSGVSGGALPDMGFYNISPIDLSAAKSFRPFGSQPREADAFYVASKEIFSKKGSKITVLFKRNRAKDKEVVKPGDGLNLSFEYWNGHLWKQIPECSDSLNKFQLYAKSDAKSEYEGSIEFPCPEDIEETDVGGERSYWIRIVLASGDFGREELKKEEVIIQPPAGEAEVVKTTTWSIDYSKIHPPILDSIYLEHKTADIKDLDGCIVKNNLEYTDLTSEIRKDDSTNRPFVSMDDSRPAIYLGFEEKLGRGNLSIFFSTAREKREAGLMVRWYYWWGDERGQGWRSLDASDNTDHLSRSDTIEFLGPAEQRRRSLFGLEIYWLRGVFEGDVTALTKLNWIRPNTTWANQVETIREEILGSSSGERSQAFGMANFPVISSEIWVLEGKPILGAEKLLLESQGQSVEDVLDSSGKSVDAWVLWTNVPDFYGSDKRNRHYQLDSLAGRVLFGDGIRGMIPPAGRENIKASYRIGGGTKGNVSANEISAFRTPIAGVDTIANHEAAEGGSDGESLSSALDRGPRVLKSMDRAVTAQDFEALAKASSSSIARTKCLIEDNTLTVIVIPDSDEERPTPSAGLIDVVSGYLAERMPASFSSDDLSVRGPVYVDVSITANLVPVTMEGAAILEKRIVNALKGYLHPLRGGADGKGWSFARSVQISDIYALIEGTSGVDHVETLKIDGISAKISGSQMVASGEHRITIRQGGDEK
jgi:hypothetical protein